MNIAVYPILFLIGAVALAIWMRRAGKDEEVSSPEVRRAVEDVISGEGRNRPGHEPASDLDATLDSDSDFGDDEDSDLSAGALDPNAQVPVTSEGIALVAAGSQVRLVDLSTPEEIPDWLERGMRVSWVPYSQVAQSYARTMLAGRGHFGGSALHHGDFTAARLRRDSSGGWNLETLGRDGDFGFMPFDTEKGAREALELIEDTGVVERPLGDDGQPLPPSPEDFEEARRRYEETERDLAIAPDDDEPPPPADWSSRR